MESPTTGTIVAAYLGVLEKVDRRFSVWKESELPFSKDVIKQSILKELRPLKNTTNNRRKQLVHAYVALANFIASDDAQLLHQCEKMTWRTADQITRGQRVAKADYELLSKYEEPSMKINARIDFEERELIADIAALNAGFTIEKTASGYTLKSHTDSPQGPRP